VVETKSFGPPKFPADMRGMLMDFISPILALLMLMSKLLKTQDFKSSILFFSG
jgi:hypothetical protein